MTLSVYINMHSFFVPDQSTARYSICSAQEKCVSLTEPYRTHMLIQFAHIPAEFVVRFIRYQYRVKVITFSIAP